MDPHEKRPTRNLLQPRDFLSALGITINVVILTPSKAKHHNVVILSGAKNLLLAVDFRS
jgi:hypothetical protein